MTAKGAAVTLSSTVASCTLACYIEIGAHRMVYHCFPHRYANVDYANGLTQEQLDAVRIYKLPTTTTAEEDVSFLLTADDDHASNNELPVIHNDDISTVYKAPTDEELAEIRPLSSTTSAATNYFWNEEKRERETLVPKKPSFMVFPSNDILACAMTG
jgi:hypothetical protein